MDEVSILLWISLIAAVPVAAAGLLLRRSAPGQGLPVRRGIIGWVLILFGILLAALVGYFFWRMNTGTG
jgi:hypothetical protein